MFDSSACSPSLEWATLDPSTSTSELGVLPPPRADLSDDSRELAISSSKHDPSIPELRMVQRAPGDWRALFQVPDLVRLLQRRLDLLRVIEMLLDDRRGLLDQRPHLGVLRA